MPILPLSVSDRLGCTRCPGAARARWKVLHWACAVGRVY